MAARLDCMVRWNTTDFCLCVMLTHLRHYRFFEILVDSLYSEQLYEESVIIQKSLVWLVHRIVYSKMLSSFVFPSISAD